MRDKFHFTCYDSDEDEEFEASLPGKNEVCSRCRGYGTHLNPSIGNHAYSAEEFYEAFPEAEDREEYFCRGGIFDVVCEKCNGNKVVLVPDAAYIEQHGDEEQKKLLSLWEKQTSEREKLSREWAREIEMESKMLGEWDE